MVVIDGERQALPMLGVALWLKSRSIARMGSIES
jgi:hypothetical protein